MSATRPLGTRIVPQRLKEVVATFVLRAGYELRPRVSALELGRTHPDLTEPGFAEVARRCAPYTMTSVERMYALYGAVRHVCAQGIPGDIVECGVWRGGSAMVAALALAEAHDSERRIWLYDTFEGMPEPGEHDLALDGTSMAATWSEHRGRIEDPVFAFATLPDVQANVARTGIAPERVHYVRGKVEDTIPQTMPEQIALLRLDTDWYDSTRHELEHLYPLLAVGGPLIIDDYGHWQGARRAVDEWLATVEQPPLLWRVDETGRVGVKPAA